MDIMQTYREIRRNFVEKKNVGGEKRPYDDLERFERGVSWFMDRYLPALDNNTKSAGQPLTGVDVLPEKGRIAVPALEGSTSPPNTPAPPWKEKPPPPKPLPSRWSLGMSSFSQIRSSR